MDLEETEASNNCAGKDQQQVNRPNGRAIYFFWWVRLLALRPLLAYCASLG
jgi:hypothetical protein